MTAPVPFPDDFTWGVATSAFQIEGATREGGRGPSIWDRFFDDGHMPDPGDPACDHYHRYDEDVALMADLGVDAYRFSVAWPRVMPDGTTVNPAGLDFYDRLVDGLLAAGVTPWLTLYHWDLPAACQDRGGWPDRTILAAFERYAGVVADRLGDRVRHWITHNEPWVATMVGHKDGHFAPGIADWQQALRAGHHILVSHGIATEAIRERVGDAQVGIALDSRPTRPATTARGRAAARHFDGFRNRWFHDPVFGRGYPADMVEAWDRAGHFVDGPLDFVVDDDLDRIATPIDFLGVNYYTSIEVAVDRAEHEDPEVEPGPQVGPGHTEMGWAITPDALTDWLVRLQAEYDPPSIVITENGASFSTGPDPQGRVRDDRRIAYLDAHLRACRRAIDRGVRLDGYFLWSLLDNLEWTSGYAQRFGIVHVDHETGTRIPKDSYWWYRDLVDEGGLRS